MKICGAPGEIRTPDPLVRSQVLYPTELRAHCMKWLRGGGQERGRRPEEARILRAGSRIRPYGRQMGWIATGAKID